MARRQFDIGAGFLQCRPFGPVVQQQFLGLEKDLGSIADGTLADLVILNGNPLDNLRNTNAIGFVMKNGRFYEGDTLTETWPERRATALPLQDDPPASLGAGIRP